tara:strand:+ start:384 stop:611 length:228 start_codon:yes stop_codon:yes gene_type:complete
MNYIYERMMAEGDEVITFSKDEYRAFTEYVNANYEDLYSENVMYEVNLVDGNYIIKMPRNNTISLSDILVDIRTQ